MKKIHWIILAIFLFVITISAITIIYIQNQNKQNEYQNKIGVLYEKESHSGPCPPNHICDWNIILYNSGELVENGKTTKNIDQQTMSKIIDEIRESGIMTGKCREGREMDYSADYKIYLDNQIAEFHFPCFEEEMTKIENLIY